MSKRYIILSVLLVLTGIGLLFIPDKVKDKELDPNQLLSAIDDPSRFLSPDFMADRIIKKDPSYLIIDVRVASQFKVYSLPGAVNVPIDSLLSAQSLSLLKQEGMNKVFCSNDDVLSDQAWQICKRMNISDIFVVKGGINEWFNTIMKDNPPSATEDSKAHDLYLFRKAARQYFMEDEGQNMGVAASGGALRNNESSKKKEDIKVEKKSPQKSSGGGC